MFLRSLMIALTSFATFQRVGVQRADAQPSATLATAPEVIVDEAADHRAWAMPTARTPRAGTWTAIARIAGFGASYAATDRLTLGLESALVVQRAYATLQLFARPDVQIAAHGEAWLGFDNQGLTVPLFGAGLVATACLSDDCVSQASAMLGLGQAFDDANTRRPSAMAAGSIKLHLWHTIYAIAELDGFAHDDFGRVGTLTWAGARLATRRLGLDLGAVRGVSESDQGIWPWLAFTWRSR